MTTFDDILKLWPSIGDLASDLAVPYGTAQVMVHRGRVPARHWLKLVGAAQRRGFEGVTAERLTEIAAHQLSTCASHAPAPLPP
jgi:hypothetical protein